MNATRSGTQKSCRSRPCTRWHVAQAVDIHVGLQKEKTALSADQVSLKLSTRERNVLRLLAQGYNNSEIAQRLVLSEKTIQNYISNISDKLEIHSRGEAIVLARQSGIAEDKK
jgi:DNA-binding NarL/FixJ family response regulator